MREEGKHEKFVWPYILIYHYFELGDLNLDVSVEYTKIFQLSYKTLVMVSLLNRLGFWILNKIFVAKSLRSQ